MIKSKYKRNLLVCLSFVAFAVFSAILIGLHGKLYIMNDSLFHSSRLLELIRSRSLFPEYTMNSFNYDGSAVMTMYPYIFLYPIVVIFKVVKSIKTAILLGFMLGTFVALMISYFSSLSYVRNWLTSFIFALIYALSGEAMAMYFYSPDSDLGVYFSFLFLPLVIFGFLDFLREGHWIMLSVGISLLAYTNVITVVFTAVLFFVWFLWNYKRITLKRCFALAKAALLMVLATAAVWLPMARLMADNQLRVPTRPYVRSVSLLNLFQFTIDNNVFGNCQCLTFYSLMGLLIGLILFRHLTNWTKQLYLFAVFVIFLSSDLFPWNLFNRNYLAINWIRSIQTTIRIMVIPQVILEFVLAALISNCVRHHSVQLKRVVMTMVIIMLGLSELAIQGSIIGLHDGVNNFSQIKTSVIRSHVLDYWPMVSATPRNSHNIQHSRVVVNNKARKTVAATHLGHGNFDFKIRRGANRLSLPFLYYYGTPYRVTLDGRPVHVYANHNKDMTLSHVESGSHHVHVEINTPRSTKVAYGVTVVGLLIYGSLVVIRIRRKDM